MLSKKTAQLVPINDLTAQRPNVRNKNSKGSIASKINLKI
jgi:hypothetical protein